MIVLDLPFPVSVNAMRTVDQRNGRIISSKTYREWQTEADGFYLWQKRKTKRVAGKFRCELVLDETRRRADCDNLAKAVLDALERWDLIDNDRLCEELSVRWGAAPEGCRVTIIPAE